MRTRWFIEILSRTNLAANPEIVNTHARQKFSYRAQGCQEWLPDEFHSRGIWVSRIRASATRRAHSISTCDRALQRVL